MWHFGGALCCKRNRVCIAWELLGKDGVLTSVMTALVTRFITPLPLVPTPTSRQPKPTRSSTRWPVPACTPQLARTFYSMRLSLTT